ncbi:MULTISPECIES: hypothetical protein [unclassified Corynebacterium]|uniref:hypothetical protein n=1 Tax=unclassified Corynebacterium TaxID=2624378 RepID=UPI0029CA3173|nr:MULTISPECIES: hypothetical protein [unclassified Corynebacterium]WPF66361.1 hypothetical protein OLX12_01125 [Corynebacterium sp. 22KM0430]WPF68851.1 hypothetical protein OLW90_01125 [Corynebacterium sp. 21KM1197]
MRSLSVATVFAALSGFLVIIIATRILDEEAAKLFQAYWGLFFACTGILDGLMQETTRTVSAHREYRERREHTAHGERREPNQPQATAHGNHGGVAKHTYAHWHFALLVGLVAAALSLLFEPVWAPLVIGGEHGMAGSGLMALGLLLYAFQAILSGVLSGWERWPSYARLIALDSGVRFLLVALAALFGWTLMPFFVITVIGSASWVLILAADPSARAHARRPLPLTLGGFARRAGSAMIATGASAAIITGIAPLINATMEEPQSESGVALAGIMLAVSLTRAPILMPLQRFQSALIVYFVRHRERMRQAVLPPAAGVLGAGALGAGLAWLLGPWILAVGWDHDPAYAVPGPLLAALTFASSCTGVLMITGTASIAAERHRLYVAGWVMASGAVCAVLWYGSDPLRTIPFALILGPLLGALVHLSALRAGSRRNATDSWDTAATKSTESPKPTLSERASGRRH